MRRRRMVGALLVAVLLLASGCWDMLSLDQRAFVVMAGIDRTPEGKFRVTAQIQVAGRTAQGTGGKEVPSNVRLLAAEADTIQLAMAKIRGQTARELDLTFLDLIVLGKTTAADLTDVEWVVRAFPVPIMTYITVSRDEAEPVVRAPALGFGIPAEFALTSFSGTGTRSPEMVAARSWLVFNRNWYTPLEDPYAPVLAVAEYGLAFDGLAVFRGTRLAGFLSTEETAIFSLLQGQRQERAVEAIIREEPPAVGAAYLSRIRVRRWVTWRGDRPTIHLQLQGRGNMRELVGMHMASAQDQAEVERALANTLIDQTTKTLRRLQELDSDPVGFGELARQAAPNRREVQNGEAWHAAWRKAEFDVTASVTVEAPGYKK